MNDLAARRLQPVGNRLADVVGMPMTHRLCALALAICLALVGPSLGHTTKPSPPPTEETLSYSWSLEGFAGALLGIFFPRHGEGSLTTGPAGDGHIRSQLLITSEQARDGEFWCYGAEIETREGHTTRAWSAYRWRGESRERESEVPEEERGVVDISSAIHALRRSPPELPRHMRIWSDGRIYPVVVIPRGEVDKTVPAGTFATRHYRVEGVRIEGERFWRGSMELWLSEDPGAVPVEILLQRSMARVRLKLDEPPAAPGSARR